jgi:hypothetical protein
VGVPGKESLPFVALLVALGSTCPVARAQQSCNVPPRQEPDTKEEGLRDVFLGKEGGSGPSNRAAGRLGILLEADGAFKRVRPDYSFRSGDRFRFEIAANRTGWLYVLHTSGGKLQQLWPAGKNTEEIRRGQTHEVPSSPGLFIFDKEVGDEPFYVVIRTDRKPPALGQTTPLRKSPDSAKKRPETPDSRATTGITNFAIRDPFGETTARGVVFAPGRDDADPYLYFSPVPQDTTNSVMIEFQLHHIE